MAMTNRERQARYRARLKAQASASCANALRDRARQIMTDEWIADGETESMDAAVAARDHVLSLPDASLVALWDRVIEETHAAEFLRFVKIARRQAKRRPLVTKSGGAAA